MWVMDSNPLQEGEMGSFTSPSSPEECDGLAALRGFVTGVEEKAVGLV